jgi:L-lysine 2,3-aminomutase
MSVDVNYLKHVWKYDLEQYEKEYEKQLKSTIEKLENMSIEEVNDVVYALQDYQHKMHMIMHDYELRLTEYCIDRMDRENEKKKYGLNLYIVQ